MESIYKVFVGNVPFSYNIKDFNECFKNVTGFIKAEIICKPNSDISRGFGFVTLNNEENARKLIGRTDIYFKDRILRFTEYYFQDKNNVQKNTISTKFIINTNKNENENKNKNKTKFSINCNNHNKINIIDNFLLHDINNMNDINDTNDINNINNINNINDMNTSFRNLCESIYKKNYLLLKNISFITTRNELKEFFSHFGEIGRHFIITDHETGLPKNQAVIEILDKKVFESLLILKNIKINDEQIIDISKWKFHKHYDICISLEKDKKQKRIIFNNNKTNQIYELNKTKFVSRNENSRIINKI
jgi:RNA recognition motif-containing protein